MCIMVSKVVVFRNVFEIYLHFHVRLHGRYCTQEQAVALAFRIRKLCNSLYSSFLPANIMFTSLLFPTLTLSPSEKTSDLRRQFLPGLCLGEDVAKSVLSSLNCGKFEAIHSQRRNVELNLWYPDVLLKLRYRYVFMCQGKTAT